LLWYPSHPGGIDTGDLNQHGGTTYSFVPPSDWRFLPKLDRRLSAASSMEQNTGRWCREGSLGIYLFAARPCLAMIAGSPTGPSREAMRGPAIAEERPWGIFIFDAREIRNSQFNRCARPNIILFILGRPKANALRAPRQIPISGYHRRGHERDLSGSQAIHPVLLPRSKTQRFHNSIAAPFLRRGVCCRLTWKESSQ
jgi:hypothetical protein